jgi:hypothetical protein
VAPGAFGKVTLDGTPTESLPDKAGAVVVELAERRARRLLADLDLAPTIESPCSGCCRCYGVPLGSGCRS